MLKIAVFSPLPNASVNSTALTRPGLRRGCAASSSNPATKFQAVVQHCQFRRERRFLIFGMLWAGRFPDDKAIEDE